MGASPPVRQITTVSLSRHLIFFTVICISYILFCLVKGRDNVGVEREEEEKETQKKVAEARDVEKGEVGLEEKVTDTNPPPQFRMSRMQRLSTTNPLRLLINSATRVPPVSCSQPPPPAPPLAHSRSTPTPQGIQGLLQGGSSTQRKAKRVFVHFLPQVEAASLLSITLAFSWQKAVRLWPKFMVHFTLWSTFSISLSAGILLICFQKPPTDGVGALVIAFAIGNGLYACWVTRRINFCSVVLVKSLEPVSKFPDLNQPTYWMLGAGFVWMSLWILAVIGSLNFYIPPLIIIVLVLSFAWTAEVMRTVVNITVSRVVALYYLRGMQSDTQSCFQRALSKNLGSACLGSLFVPAIEALRIVARGLNLLEGEDEFMFSCAHCCLGVMESIFRYGNGWAYVQIAAYGKGFVKASQDTWELFEKGEMENIVDSDMTSAICFLTGVCSGSICVIVVAAWTARVHQGFTATLSLLAFFISYLMTRIAMALPQACVSCYYACYAENPDNRLFDKTIPDRLNTVKSNRDAVVPTPRIPRRRSRA